MKKEKTNYVVIGMALGAAFGSAIGVIYDNIAMGIAMGVSIGTALGFVVQERRKTRQSLIEMNEMRGCMLESQ